MESESEEFKEKIKNQIRYKYIEDDNYFQLEGELFKVTYPRNIIYSTRNDYYENIINNHNSSPINVDTSKYKILDSCEKFKKKKKNIIINTAINIKKINKFDRFKNCFNLKIKEKRKYSLKVRDKRIYKRKKYLEYSWEKNRRNNNKEILEQLRLDKKYKNKKLDIFINEMPQEINDEIDIDDIHMDINNNKHFDEEKIKEENEFYNYIIKKIYRRNTKYNKPLEYLDPKYYNIIKINPNNQNKMQIENESDDMKCDNILENVRINNENNQIKEDALVNQIKNVDSNIINDTNNKYVNKNDNKPDIIIIKDQHNIDISSKENIEDINKNEITDEELKIKQCDKLNQEKNCDNMCEENEYNRRDNNNKDNIVSDKDIEKDIKEKQKDEAENKIFAKSNNILSNKNYDISSINNDISEVIKQDNFVNSIDNEINPHLQQTIQLKIDKLSPINKKEEIIIQDDKTNTDFQSHPVEKEINNINLDIINEEQQVKDENQPENKPENKPENNSIPLHNNVIKIPFVSKKNNKYYLFLKQFKKIKFPNTLKNNNSFDESIYKYIKDNLNDIREIRKYLKSHNIDERKVIDILIECNNNIYTPVTIDEYIPDLYLDSFSYIFKYDLINAIDKNNVNIYWGNYKYFIFVRYGNYTDRITDKSDTILSKDLFIILKKGNYEYYTSIVYKINDNSYISYLCIKFLKNTQINTCYLSKWLMLENNKEKFYHIRSENYGNCQIEYNNTKYYINLDIKLKNEDKELLKLYKEKTTRFGYY